MDPGPGDVVRLRKNHPCGSCEWLVIRLGADIGIKCQGCGRYVLLERAVFQRRLRAIVSKRARGEAGEAAGRD
ncbi:MAG: DUF951 domain-containing protein [Dehalococcoidia bacterium]|nr:DUF951 domain-containing protein [Dehalococcoidia bacterium]